jgi:hypothetical protein
MGPAIRSIGCIGLGAALVALAPGAWADAGDPDDADAGAPVVGEPTGPLIVYATPPAMGAETRTCSFRRPICVHASARTDPGRVLRVLASAERAWDAASWGLALPLPDTDLSTGAFDVYLIDGVDSVPEGARAELAGRDALSSFDRANAFLRVAATLDGCALDTAMARETVRAILWRKAPATDPVTARAETSYLARLMVPCAFEAPGGVEAFQSHPEGSLYGAPDAASIVPESAASAEEYAAGASLFYWWLDYSFGNAPGSVVRALWALAPTQTPGSASRWVGRPDGFDVLAASFKGALTSGSTMDDLLLDFAVARAFVGDSSDKDHMPETRALGAAARLRTEWTIEWPKAPRKLASSRGVAPTGAAYVEVDCRSAPKGARLRFEAEWEEHAKMRWAAVEIDDAGHERSSVAITGPDRGTAAQGTVVDLDGVARVLFVGTNTGDPLVPFDLNDAAPEPHGFVVSVASETP